MRFLARPLGVFFFSCLSTLGVAALTLPARAREPWTRVELVRYDEWRTWGHFVTIPFPILSWGRSCRLGECQMACVNCAVRALEFRFSPRRCRYHGKVRPGSNSMYWWQAYYYSWEISNVQSWFLVSTLNETTVVKRSVVSHPSWKVRYRFSNKSYVRNFLVCKKRLLNLPQNTPTLNFHDFQSNRQWAL